ncbi:MAG: HAD family hydrolase [Candidatus Acetothermia bacterium]
MIKTITFDFGGVLYAYDEIPLIKTLAERSDASLVQMKEALSGSQLNRAHFRGELEASTLLERLKERINLRMSVDELADTYARCVTPNEDIFKLVERLHTNYNLQLYSDTPKLLYDHVMTKMPVFGYFSAKTLSFEVGELKDSEAGYLDMIEKSRHTPGEIAFIDDRVEYAMMARELDVNGIQYSNTEKLTDDLKQLDVEIA